MRSEPTVPRSRVYRVLAAAFSRPKTDTGELYDSVLAIDSVLQPLEASNELSHGSEGLSLATLAKEYLRLFVGPGHIPCAPYESVHRKDRPDFERGLVMGPSTADVRRAYLAAGLDVSKSYTDLPDHIAAEMEFMQFLCAEETRLTTEGKMEEAAKVQGMQREFHKNHIQPWVGDFADCVLRSTNSPFYAAAANTLKHFAKVEGDFLRDGP